MIGRGWLAGAAKVVCVCSMCAAFLTLFAASSVAAQGTVVLPREDNLLRDRPVDVWSVGSEEGESWELLSNVRSAAFDSKDNLYVLDAGNHRVLVFDAAGRFVRQIGKQGGGPGEFQFPTQIVVLPDDRLVVVEGRGMSVFGPDGTYEALHSVGAPGNSMGRLLGGRVYAHPSGGVVLQNREIPEPGQVPPEGGMQPAPIVRVQPGVDGPPETIFPLMEPAPQVTETTSPDGRRMRLMMGQRREVFESAPSWALLSDGTVAFHEGSDYRIRLGSAGRETGLLTRPIQPRPATERDRERAREERREQLRSAPSVSVGGGGVAVFSTRGGGGSTMTDEQVDQMISRMTFPERVHVVHGLLGDPLGRLWIERAPAIWGDAPPIDLVGTDGRYIGTIPAMRLPMAVSRSGMAMWVERDDLDIERVVVRQLPERWK